MTDLAEVDPGWLGQELRAAGHDLGEVVQVHADATDAFNSHTLKLRVRFTPNDAGEPLTRLVLKRTIDQEWAVSAANREVGFYRLVASLGNHPRVVPPCVASGTDDPATGRPWLLLADLSATHAPPLSRGQQIASGGAVPAPQHIAQVTATLARLHAYWWEHPLQQAGVLDLADWFGDSTRFDTFVRRRTAAWQWVRDSQAGHLPAGAHTLYEHVLAALRTWWEAWLQPRARGSGLTLVHGDAYFANFLCPLDSALPGTAYLLDWQFPGFNLGALDLVNLCATFWTSGQRQEHEREYRILQDYHARLTAGGVAGYTLDDLHRDYRIAIIYWLLVPLQDAYGGSAPAYWLPKMQCLMSAYHDWNCDQIG